MKPRATSPVLSRESINGLFHWTVAARNLNPWCRIPGSPFSRGFFLFPNTSKSAPVCVTFGPFNVPDGIDSFAFALSGDGSKRHGNAIRVDLIVSDEFHRSLTQSTACLCHSDQRVVTVRFDAASCKRVCLRFFVSYHALNDTSAYGGIKVDYGLGYRSNPLIDLLNRMRSDKGTEAHAGNGVPHCYAVEYYRLFEGFRQEPFNLLEIGLCNVTEEGGGPQDAPSLRAWREFFPNAKIFGYDVKDFSFFKQEATFTFQGDQSSRDDVVRFLDEYGRPRFKVILDDGSHASSHQQISLAGLFEQVESAGMYVIEDLGWQPFEESPKTLDVLDRFVTTGKIESPFIQETEARKLEASIQKVEIYKPHDYEMAVIYKKPSD